MVVVVELRHPQARLPQRAHPSDACFDLYLPQAQEIKPGETVSWDMGFAVQLEEGWEAQIRGRSGLAKRGIWVHLGTIDHLYRQNVWVILHNLSSETVCFQAGDRIAQMKIARVEDVELTVGTVEVTARGGLGSTGQ